MSTKPKYLSILILLFLLVGCDNKQSDRKNNIESLELNKLINSYEPNDYQKENQDTIIDSEKNLRLQIKRYTLMDKGFEVPLKIGENKKNIIHFRDYAVDIKLTLDETTQYADKIEKEDFSNYIDDKSFLELAYLSNVSFEKYDKKTGEVIISFMTAMIESDYAYIFELVIDQNGEKKFKLKQTT